MEKRSAVLVEDGSHGWLGRHTEPSEAELSEVARGLGAAGLVGWLVVTEGVYYNPKDTLSVLMVRPLNGNGDWGKALAAFHTRRKEALVG